MDGIAMHAGDAVFTTLGAVEPGSVIITSNYLGVKVQPSGAQGYLPILLLGAIGKTNVHQSGAEVRAFPPDKFDLIIEPLGDPVLIRDTERWDKALLGLGQDGFYVQAVAVNGKSFGTYSLGSFAEARASSEHPAWKSWRLSMRLKSTGATLKLLEVTE